MQRLERYAHLFTNDVQDIRGAEATDSVGVGVGRVQALMVDDMQGKVRFLEVATAPLSAVRLVPVDAIADLREGRVTLTRLAERVRTSPLPPAQAPLPEWAELYRHSGYTPHWEAGNIFPGYPTA